MRFVFDPPSSPSVAIAGTDDRFPVRRIFCVGRNYAEHAKEMGNDPKSDPPIFFTKPADAVADSGAAIAYPPGTESLHHESELVIALGKGGVNIAEADALTHVFGFAAGVDLTKRDTQAAAKKAGAPWDAAKGFDFSAPVGALTKGALPASARLWLTVNGETRQDANTADMIWKPAEIIAALSGVWELKAGDLIFTGSPAGVSALSRGDVVICGVEGAAELRFTIR
jgi:fumarylpyruvate hydrolase